MRHSNLTLSTKLRFGFSGILACRDRAVHRQCRKLRLFFLIGDKIYHLVIFLATMFLALKTCIYNLGFGVEEFKGTTKGSRKLRKLETVLTSSTILIWNARRCEEPPKNHHQCINL